VPSVEALRAARAEAEYADVCKSAPVAYALWAVCGLFGGHRFYLGDTGRSVAMLFTFGGLGMWTLVDVFLIAGRVRAVNRARRAAVFARHGILEAEYREFDRMTAFTTGHAMLAPIYMRRSSPIEGFARDRRSDHHG
jgi:TM2 domain-containing membrane protein YozV